jgi:hypothetical protein
MNNSSYIIIKRRIKSMFRKKEHVNGVVIEREKKIKIDDR